MPPLQPLDGVRVLDFSLSGEGSGIAGAYASKLLADAGAEVWQIEPPGGAPLRKWSASGRSRDENGDGVLYRMLATSKRAATIDLASEEGRSSIRALYAGTDLVLDSFAPGHLDALGLGDTTLAEVNPRASMLRLTPFGSRSSWRGRASSEFTLAGVVRLDDVARSKGIATAACRGRGGGLVLRRLSRRRGPRRASPGRPLRSRGRRRRLPARSDHVDVHELRQPLGSFLGNLGSADERRRAVDRAHARWLGRLLPVHAPAVEGFHAAHRAARSRRGSDAHAHGHAHATPGRDPRDRTRRDPPEDDGRDPGVDRGLADPRRADRTRRD